MARKKPIEMSVVKQVIRMYMNGIPYRDIADAVSINKETVVNYIRRARESGKDLNLLLDMADSPLEALLRGGKAAYPDTRFERFKELLPYFEEELKRHGVTRKLLWEEYRKDNPNGYSLTQFNEHIKQEIKALKDKRPYTVLTDTYVPGERLLVDFAGKTLQYVDVETGEACKVQVFLATMPASDYGFIYAVPSQRMEDFLTAMRKCINALGGVPIIWTPDNLKAAVTKANRYDPTLNEAFLQMANHYGASVIPARSLHPQDKALVENQVKMAYRWIYAPLRDRVFTSLHELNEALAELMQKHNQKRLTGRDYNREEYFLAKEKPALRPLPETDYEYITRKTVKVQNNNCVLLSEDHRYYSVPYAYIGQTVTLTYTSTLVKVYLKGECIASHTREFYSKTRSNMTYKDEHFAPQAGAYRKRSKEYYIERAGKICDELAMVITNLFDSNKNRPEQYYYNSCDGLLHLIHKDGNLDILKKACQIALKNQVYSYPFIKDLVASRCAGISDESQSTATVAPPEHENIRGREAYR